MNLRIAYYEHFTKKAADPQRSGRNWTIGISQGLKHWTWGDSTGIQFTVSEHEAQIGKYYKLTCKLADGTLLSTIGQKTDPKDWFSRAAAIYRQIKSDILIDFTNMPERWSNLTPKLKSKQIPT